MALKLFLILYCLITSYPFSESLAEPLRVGAPLALTGPAAVHGSSIFFGLKKAKEHLQTQGEKIELVVDDDGTNSQRTVAAVHRMRAAGINFFIGPTWSFQISAAAPIFEQTGSVAIIPQGSSDINGVVSSNIFSLILPRTKAEPLIVEFLAAKKVKRIFIVTPEQTWGDVHRQMYLSSAKKLSLDVIGDERFSYGSPKSVFANILLKAKDADAVLFSGADSEDMFIYRTLREFKRNTITVGTQEAGDLVRSGALSRSDFSEGDHVIVPALEQKVTSFDVPKDLNREYVIRGYDALTLLAHAVKQSDGSPAAVREYLKKLKGYKGLSGIIEFDPQNDRATGNYEIHKILDLPEK